MILESILPLTLLLWLSLTFMSRWIHEWNEFQCERILFGNARSALESPEKYRGRRDILNHFDGIEGVKKCGKISGKESRVRFYFLQE